MPTFPAYTVRLWAVNAMTGTVTGPGPPSGSVWVVRDITFQPAGIAPAVAGSFQLSSTAGAIIWGWSFDEMIAGHFYTWEGRQTVETGEQLVGQALAPGGSWAVTGYQLSI